MPTTPNNNRRKLTAGTWSVLPNHVRDSGALKKVNGPALRVYVALVLRAWWRKGGVVSESVRQLAADVGMNIGNVSRAIADLLRLRLIELLEKGYGPGKPATYRIIYEAATVGGSATGGGDNRCAGDNGSVAMGATEALSPAQQPQRDRKTETKNAQHSSGARSNDTSPQTHADDVIPADTQTLPEGFDSAFGLIGSDAGKHAPTTPPLKPKKPVCTARQAEAIYATYPRKVGKRTALAAIQRAVRRLADKGHDDPISHLIERTKTYASSPAGQRPPPGSNDYRPYPRTWFAQERFLDDDSEWEHPNGEHNRTTTASTVEGNPSPQRIAAERRAQQAQREYGEHIDVPEL